MARVQAAHITELQEVRADLDDMRHRWVQLQQREERSQKEAQQSQRLLRRATNGQLQASAAEHERTQRKLDAAYAQVRVCYSGIGNSRAGKHADALSDRILVSPSCTCCKQERCAWTQMYARVEGKHHSCS
jgi:hypothetical protein